MGDAVPTSPDAALPTVLIVEDDANLRFITRRIVERECGFRVLGEAVDGEQGVRLARALRPNVVILDLGMPVMDGFTALPLILDASPGTSVVVYSGRERHEAEAQSLARGASAFVEKDPSSATLVRALCAAVHDAARVEVCACAVCAPA